MPMISESTPVAFSDPLPDAADVVVIGAGVVGTATALVPRAPRGERRPVREGAGRGGAVEP